MQGPVVPGPRLSQFRFDPTKLGKSTGHFVSCGNHRLVSESSGPRTVEPFQDPSGTTRFESELKTDPPQVSTLAFDSETQIGRPQRGLVPVDGIQTTSYGSLGASLLAFVQTKTGPRQCSLNPYFDRPRTHRRYSFQMSASAVLVTE
jgi:hypothetical protein